jgi:molybdenum cofactor cytidylyltransferase
VAKLAGIVLAAGESRRMGYPKPLLKIDERTFVEVIVATMLEVMPRVIVVLGAHAARIRPAIVSIERITIVENPTFTRGQLSSIKVGIEQVPIDADGAVVHLADHPTVRADTFRAVISAYGHGGHPIVIARHDGHRGHPVIFDRSVFNELLRAPESEGARYVVNADPSRVGYADVEDPGVILDLDTPEDLARAGLKPPPSGA